jgi:hypothetical protein
LGKEIKIRRRIKIKKPMKTTPPPFAAPATMVYIDIR